MTPEKPMPRAWHFISQPPDATPTPLTTREKWGTTLWFANLLLYWGEEINQRKIYAARVREWTKTVVNGGLILFGVLGLMAWGAVFFELIQQQRPLQSFLFVRHPWLLVFWLSVLIDLFIVY